jgi:adenosylmethionine-8-amino-7-oxononanoate aminotransferase/alkylhydroperoxidase family enzyme
MQLGMLLAAAPHGLFMHGLAMQPRVRTFPTLMKLGYDVDRFAGRYALGKNLPAVESKSGFTLSRSGSGEVRLLGGACSEVLGGANLAKLLKNGYNLEVRAMEAMQRDEPAAALSVHTSAGVPPELDEFLKALEPHIPTKTGDWCVNLQAEGASAVHAAIDMALQWSQPGADFSRPDARNRVACGASSYHGPASTSPGGATPLGAVAKGLTHKARYPVPSPFFRRRGEDDPTFHARLLVDFEQYLDMYEHEIGVLLIEPQWGSSVAAMPWPPSLLRQYIHAAKARGIAVIADEIMCGLGRHGVEPAEGGTGCFLSECWDLQPDVLTFGKSIGGGAGQLLSGAILLDGASKLQVASRTAFQSHTYAGSSARALANGAALLNELQSWRPSVRAIEAAIAPVVAELNEACGGAMIAHGHGALWGGLFAHADPMARTAANLAFKRRCAAKGVLPYFVPVGGFMLTPRYDDEPAAFGAALQDMADCALETVREMGWGDNQLLPVEGPASAAPPQVPRFKGHDADDEAREATQLDGATARATPWLASPPLASAARELGRVCWSGTSLSSREAEIAILATAYAYRAGAEWSVHVVEARKAGLADEHIAAIARGCAPAFAPHSKERAIYAVANDLLEHKRVSAVHYAQAVASLGETGVVELVSLVGYYGYVALTLNAFEIDGPHAPEAHSPKLPWEADAGLAG